MLHNNTVPILQIKALYLHFVTETLVREFAVEYQNLILKQANKFGNIWMTYPLFLVPTWEAYKDYGMATHPICESAYGRLFEVTTKGETVWEYVIPEFELYPSPIK